MTVPMNPDDEFPHAHPGTPNWTESFMFQAYSPGSRVGCFFHLGRASWGDPNLWLERFTLNLPDGTVAVSGAYRKGSRPRGGGTEACYADCIEPFGAWKLGFDAAVQLTTVPEMLTGALRMGAQVPLRLELDWRPIGPVWDQRDMKIASIKSVHFEQAGWLTGSVEVAGARYPFEGPGRRDRSWGVRNLASLEEHTILHGEFPEAGIAFATAWICVTGAASTPARGYVAFGDALEDVAGAVLPDMDIFSPAGLPFEAVLPSSRGDLRISGKVLQTFIHTLLRPNGVAPGADLGPEDLSIMWGAQVELRLGDAIGYGFLERSAKGDKARAAAAQARKIAP